MDITKLIFIFSVTISVIFLVRYIFSLYKSKRRIELEVTDCKTCPFRYKTEGMIHQSCKLHDIVENSNDNFSDLTSMKNNCPIEGKLKITIVRL